MPRSRPRKKFVNLYGGFSWTSHKRLLPEESYLTRELPARHDNHRVASLWDFHQNLEEFPQQGLSHSDT